MPDDDVIAEIEELEATGGDHSQVAAELERRAHAAVAGSEGRRAAFLIAAGEHWEFAGDGQRSLGCFEEAVAGGGDAVPDARAYLVQGLFRAGRDEDALRLVDELRRDASTGRPMPFVHEFLGETLEHAGRLQDAQRWFTAGLVRAEADEPDRGPESSVDVLALLGGRFRVRRALGLPSDRYDERFEERRSSTGWGAADVDDLSDWDADEGVVVDDRGDLPPEARTSGSRVTVAVLYWPPEQLQAAVARWPQFAEEYGTHDEHRAQVEATLRGLSEEGQVNVVVAEAEVPAYLRFAESRDLDPASSDARARFGRELAAVGAGRRWPPGRNHPCWCGSGRKYKKCCGLPRPAGQG